MKPIQFLTLICASVIGLSDGAKILMIMPMLTKSHNTMFEYTAKVLADRGHVITLVTPYPLNKPYRNIEQFLVGDGSDLAENEEHNDYFSGKQEGVIEFFFNYADFFVDACAELYKVPQIKSIVDHVTRNKGAKLYDLAMVEMIPTECALPFASLVANHTTLLSVVQVPFWLGVELRIPSPTSSVSQVYMTDFATPSNFYRRFMNTYNSIAFYLLWKYKLIPRMEEISKTHLPPWSPSVMNSLQEISLILINTDTISEAPRPSVPFVQMIGGIHLQESKPLPKDLEEFMQSSGNDGVVLFSFGSFISTRSIPTPLRDEFFKALGKLKQKVIWKYHEQVENCPKNIKLAQWLPQRDILAHPKTRLYMIHGGILSTQEVLYHGVPIVGIPLGGDQIHNVDMLRELGIGEMLPINQVTADTLYQTITKVLNDKSYAVSAKEASAIQRDRQNSPSSSVVFWTEYVIRHKGASHLRNQVAQQLSLFQYLLLDVLAAIVLMLLLGLLALIFTIKIIRNLLFRQSDEMDKQKKS